MSLVKYIREIFGWLPLPRNVDEYQSPKVVIVGGGAAGITVSAQLKRSGVDNITIIDPSDYHYYQSGFGLFASGLYSKEEVRKKMVDVIPRRVNLITDSVIEFDPKNNELITQNSGPVKYDYLVVAAGLDQSWSGIKGLPEGLGFNEVCSYYSWDNLQYSITARKKFKVGTAIFFQPKISILLPNPQRIMFLFDDFWTRKNIKHKTSLFVPTKFHQNSPQYEDAISEMFVDKGIERKYHHDLIEVKPLEKTAVFKDLENDVLCSVPFDFLHVVPRLVPMKFIKNSPLSDEDGYVNVDKGTMIHKTYPNILSLGDCSSLPTSKTVTAIIVQAPILVHNLLNLMEGKTDMKQYEGYSADAIYTEGKRGKLILSEHTNGRRPYRSFLSDRIHQSKLGYFLKTHLFPLLYWHGLLTGRYKCEKEPRFKGFF